MTAGGEVLASEEVVVKGDGVVKEEMMETNDGAHCDDLKEDPLSILPGEVLSKGERGVVKEELVEMEEGSLNIE